MKCNEGETGIIIITNLRFIVSFAVAVHTSHFYWGFAPNEKKVSGTSGKIISLK